MGKGMKRGMKLLAAALLAAAATIAGHSSQAVERLQGAWATSAARCDQVFAKRNGRLVFKNSADGWSGFIATGKQVRGTQASCEAVSSKQKGDVLTVLLSCQTKIIFETMSVSVRLMPDGGLVRFDPDFPEVETSYNRCDK